MAAIRAQITTVITAATSYDLSDLATVKDELGIDNGTKDDLLRRYLASASVAAASYCNRVFVSEAVQDEFWPYRDRSPVMGGVEPLQLTRWPIIPIDPESLDGTPLSVVEGDTDLVVDTDYAVDATNGQLVRLNAGGLPRRWSASPIVVRYTAGYAEIPADLADAVVRMVRARWFSRGRDPYLRSESIVGVRDVSYWIATGSEAGNFPPDVADILNGYRVPLFA